MHTYGARVRVHSSSGTSTEWTEVQAANPIAARRLLEGMYGRGNVVGIPVLVT